MLLMFQKSIRYEITQAVNRHAKVNNKYIRDQYKPSEKEQLPSIFKCKQPLWMCNDPRTSNVWVCMKKY